MNAGPTDVRSSHLDLDDLIAGAAGRPVGDSARRHLASCERCRLEANRWSLVADGVRGLAAAAPETPRPHVPRRTGDRARPPWRRALLIVVTAAAALVLLIGVGVVAGVVHVRFGSGTEPILTAVTGCAGLEEADGTLKQVNGSSLVIQTAGGRPVTVTTTSSTFISRSGPLLNSVTDGSSVMVRGYSSGETIRASIITVGQPFSAVSPPGFVPVQGTVSNASTAGFTLVTSTGTRVDVITSASTLVVVPHASTNQLQSGTPIFALGNPAPNGTLSARAVAAVSQLPSEPRINVRFSVKDCSSSSIVAALGAISTAGASAG